MINSQLTDVAKPSRFVCVFNRRRDDYQVPLALAEAGLLECFVTDFYLGESPKSLWPEPLRRRALPGLPAAKVKSVWRSFLLQAVLSLWGNPPDWMWPLNGRILAKTAAKSARQSGSALYCYSYYLPESAERQPGRPVIDFEFHPDAALSLEILREDAAAYPECAQSFARELLAERIDRRHGWHLADAVVCASTMTRRSLEYAGCDPAKITVIPYGAPPPTAALSKLRPPGTCRFLFVGQGIQRKGLHHLLSAWPEIAATGAELTLVCYAIDPALAAMANQPGVRLLARQGRSDLEQIYSAHDVFVMPSLIEGFGLVYLEALAAGCHVIGTPNTGLPDLPLDSAALTLVSPGQIDELAAAMRALVERKEQGSLNPPAIAAQAAKWQWADFRKAIADHARAVLSGEDAR